MGSTSQKKRNLKNKIKRKQTTEFKTGGQAEILVGGVGLKYWTNYQNFIFFI